MSIIEKQQLFQKIDLVNGDIKSFCNTLDKGCRVTHHILRNFQTVIQPRFSKGNQNFKGIEGLCISEVASDRSGNERAVKCVKLSGYLADGAHKHQYFIRVNNVWKAFAFQINFMHRPVV